MKSTYILTVYGTMFFVYLLLHTSKRATAQMIPVYQTYMTSLYSSPLSNQPLHKFGLLRASNKRMAAHVALKFESKHQKAKGVLHKITLVKFFPLNSDCVKQPGCGSRLNFIQMDKDICEKV